MVVGSPGLRAEAELPRFLGLGPLQRGVLQQLMHTEFSFPGEQKDWYPAEAMRQAAEDAHDLRYMIPATQTQRSRVNEHCRNTASPSESKSEWTLPYFPQQLRGLGPVRCPGWFC
jgi:hypothetical protein